MTSFARFSFLYACLIFSGEAILSLKVNILKNLDSRSGPIHGIAGGGGGRR
jgi:hypothetical protein